jgi:transcriptional regulator with GAF, ATPase, and Fis domain/Tfp pilus assembly protein PilF
MQIGDEPLTGIEELRRRLESEMPDSERLKALVQIGAQMADSGNPEAKAKLEEAVDLARRTRDHESLVTACQVLAELLIGAGDLETSQKTVECIRDVADEVGNKRWLGSYHYISGVIAYTRADYRSARECYAKSRELWKSTGLPKGEMAVLNQLAMIANLQGDLQEALAYYQESLRLSEELQDKAARINTTYNIGVALQALGRWEDAAESYYRALAMAGDDPLYQGPRICVYTCLGEIFLRRNKPAKAIDILRNTIREAESRPGALKDLCEALMNLGHAYHRQGDLASAGEAYGRVLAIAGEAGDRRATGITLRRTAELALSEGAPDRAWELNERSLDVMREIGLKPEEAEALRVRALIRAERGEFAEAEQDFEDAIAAQLDSEEGYELAEVRFHYGKFLLRRGRKDAAVRQLKAAARVFRKLSVVAETEEINRLLFSHEMGADTDMALLQGISGLATLGLEPPAFLDQGVKLMREALMFDSAAVMYGDRALLLQGSPDVERATALGKGRDFASSPTVLSWPVESGGQLVGRIYLQRAKPLDIEHNHLVLETAANLLVTSMQRVADTALRAVEIRPDLAGLRYRGVPGKDPNMVKVLAMVCRVAGTNVPVLIRGESGTGKELIARALHESGPRAAKPFVPVNCAALPEQLLEAEFFGVEKGAATGVAARKGKFEQADGGTVFLDEIGDMSPLLQAKLLRVLQDKVVERVGGRQPTEVDVRIVAATNRDVCELVAEGRFRQDLYYRLNGVELELPALRERRGDIPELVQHYITVSNQEFGRRVTGATPEVIRRFVEYPWPGNIRELQHVIERAVILAAGDTLGPADLPAVLAGLAAPSGPAAPADLRTTRRLVKEEAGAGVERAAILDCLEKTGWKVGEAAKLAGYSRAQFYRLLGKHGIERPAT